MMSGHQLIIVGFIKCIFLNILFRETLEISLISEQSVIQVWMLALWRVAIDIIPHHVIVKSETRSVTHQASRIGGFSVFTQL